MFVVVTHCCCHHRRHDFGDNCSNTNMRRNKICFSQQQPAPPARLSLLLAIIIIGCLFVRIIGTRYSWKRLWTGFGWLIVVVPARSWGGSSSSLATKAANIIWLCSSGEITNGGKENETQYWSITCFCAFVAVRYYNAYLLCFMQSLSQQLFVYYDLVKWVNDAIYLLCYDERICVGVYRC